MSARIFWTVAAIGGLGTALIANAQSPFASNKPKAWETAPAPSTYQEPAYQAPSYQAPSYQAPSYETPSYEAQDYQAPSYEVPTYQAPTYETPTYQAPSYQAPTSVAAPIGTTDDLAGGYGSYTPSTYQAPTYQEPSYQAPTYQAPSYPTPSSNGPNNSGQYNSGQYDVPDYVPSTIGTGSTTGATDYQNTYQDRFKQDPYGLNPGYQAPNYPAQTQASPAGLRGPQYGPATRATKPSWKDRLGFGNLATSLKGYLKLGAAAVKRGSDTEDSKWGEGFIADGKIRGEASLITDSGLEYGAGLMVRGQYDEDRRGFGGLVGDCPADVAGCPSVLVNGVATPIRGHTSRFYAGGVSDAKSTEVALEGAYLFLRSGFGDFTVGRDDGAAYLFSLGAPSVVAVNASNSPVDYTGLDSVKTINDASGFSEKITYVSPRLLGDRIGVGVQLGASYALNARACGVDYCVRENGEDGTGVLAPDLTDVVELGLSLDRTFNNGFSVEATGTYAMASEASGLAAFDDLTSYGAGLEFGYHDFTLGGSWLQSNNGLMNGDYTAYDVGLAWQPSQWGMSLSYGHAEDELVNLISDQATFGVSYDLSDSFSIGTGAQYVQRRTPFVSGTTIGEREEDGLGLFIEGGFKF